MLVLKLTVLLLCVYVIKGEDFEWLPCLQKALAKGVPSLNIPSHDSFVFNFKRTFDKLLNEIDAEIDANVMWKNIPWWMVKNYTVIDSNDEYVTAEYDLFWKSFTIDSAFRLNLTVPPDPKTEYVGTFNINLTNVNWNGNVTLKRARGSSTQYLDDLTIRWTNEGTEASARIPELIFDIGLVTEVLEDGIQYLSDTNYLGESFKQYLNENWLQNASNYEALMEWCIAG